MIYLFNFVIFVLTPLFLVKTDKLGKTSTIAFSDSLKKSVFFSIDTLLDGKENINLNFYYHDELGLGNPILITKKGTNIILKKPTFLFEANNLQTPFLIYPDEKINIKYANTDSLQLYIIGNEIRSNELNFFRKLVQKTGNIYYAFSIMSYHKKVSTLNNFHLKEKTINEQKIKRIKLLKTYNLQYPISDKFFAIAINSILYTALYDSLLLIHNNKTLLIQNKLYFNLLQAKLISIKNIDFLPYQFSYITHSMLFSLLINEVPNSVISTEKEFIKKFDFAAQNFTTLRRDFLLSKTINMANTDNVVISKKYIDKYRLLCLSEDYKKIVLETLNEKDRNLKEIGTDNLLLSDGKTIKDFISVITQNQGKLILLDFWASWCVPCRVEMPYSKNLNKTYAGKDIIFIYVSTDKKTENWLNANSEELIDKKYSYLLLNPDQSTFIKKYNLFSIPRYMLLGKDGTLIDENAPRPSDIRLKNIIDKNL